MHKPTVDTGATGLLETKSCTTEIVQNQSFQCTQHNQDCPHITNCLNQSCLSFIQCYGICRQEWNSDIDPTAFVWNRNTKLKSREQHEVKNNTKRETAIIWIVLCCLCRSPSFLNPKFYSENIIMRVPSPKLNTFAISIKYLVLKMRTPEGTTKALTLSRSGTSRKYSG